MTEPSAEPRVDHRQLCPTCGRPSLLGIDLAHLQARVVLEAITVTLPGDDLGHFQARVLQDAVAEATAAYWLHRAEQFDAARPQPRDYAGKATPAELAAR